MQRMLRHVIDLFVQDDNDSEEIIKMKMEAVLKKKTQHDHKDLILEVCQIIAEQHFLLDH